jgi:hypothetical protein
LSPPLSPPPLAQPESTSAPPAMNALIASTLFLFTFIGVCLSQVLMGNPTDLGRREAPLKVVLRLAETASAYILTRR